MERLPDLLAPGCQQYKSGFIFVEAIFGPKHDGHIQDHKVTSDNCTAGYMMAECFYSMAKDGLHCSI